ncbi:hypothetical protein ACFQO7_37505 [Catellatospora aurea]|uniref:Uncharacterized protein n=1 Tax=Catellatospora aurea TaxID=1337874 RepID=A0ABW2H7C5_9ACTN
MQIEMGVDGDGDVVAQLNAWLASRPDLAGMDVRRARATVVPGQLGAVEVLAFLATEVTLPLVLNAVYDFFRSRRRSRPAERARVTVTWTDHPDGTRTTMLDLDGPADAVVEAAHAALEGPAAGA